MISSKNMSVGVVEIDLPAFMMKMRAALLMQARWIEDHPINDPSGFLVTLRRANLEIVREIEHELGLKPKRRKIIRKRS